ncbi:sialic acid-binding Ig-like lectin 13 isoform X1 [Embiotoca jacksoni]|uniref:sialic acid-binding Ig-like lectin 13 isoform X1 n=1 Tax=Embiotoca jacksoni TaxID=100190 RepID=UPI003704D282
MFVLIWAALLLSVRGSNANTGSSVGETWCRDGYCVALSEEELTAEAGLCVVIPCTFSSPLYFKHIVWFKCEPSRPNCGDSDRIFNSNMYGKTVQDGFKGRVSLLESNLSQTNCSIIINDLKESDSGSYQFRVNFHYSGFSFPPRATVSVKGLSQKPTVMIPPLTEGQQTTLTCIAPGLCSGSVPKITWTWKGKGENDSHISGNITHVNTEALSPVTQIHSSTLTFNSSAEHHGTEITCKISFTGNTTTEETKTLNVTRFPRILSSSACEVQSEVLTCVCISEGIPLPIIEWPLLRNHTEYSVTSTVTLTVKKHGNTAVECVSINENGEMKQSFIVLTSEGKATDHHGPSAVLLLITAVVSLIVNVIFIIYFGFLWNSRKKVKPNQEDRTYMSLQKTDRSPEYDVIGQSQM